MRNPLYKVLTAVLALPLVYWSPQARAQVMTTVASLSALALSAGAALGGVLHDPLALIGVFVATNLLAAAGAVSRGAPVRPRDRA